MTKRIICIYHANCADGFTAAWCVHKIFGDQAEYIPAAYGQEPPDVTGAEVIMVDFSYKRPVIDAMLEQCESMVILDHHDTAQNELRGLPHPGANYGEWRSIVASSAKAAFAEFDMNRSGAQIAWDFFNTGNRPKLVDYVADRDLWKWQMEDSREISAAISSREHIFEYWYDLAKDLQKADFNRAHWVSIGHTILRQQSKYIDSIIASSKREMIIGGHSVPVANCPPFLASEVAGKMAETAPFAATYFDSGKGRGFSLRSRKNGLTVNDIAESYGGGGHPQAAGFGMPIGWEGDIEDQIEGMSK